MSALLLVAEWILISIAPVPGAVVVYLHISGLGPILGSGFWLVATERFDPRTAKRTFSQIAGWGSFDGLLGAVLADRVAILFGVSATLPVLAVLNLICAWQISRLAPASISPAEPKEFSHPDWNPIELFEPAR